MYRTYWSLFYDFPRLPFLRIFFCGKILKQEIVSNEGKGGIPSFSLSSSVNQDAKWDDVSYESATIFTPFHRLFTEITKTLSKFIHINVIYNPTSLDIL